jgi:hypothetical protein
VPAIDGPGDSIYAPAIGRFTTVITPWLVAIGWTSSKGRRRVPFAVNRYPLNAISSTLLRYRPYRRPPYRDDDRVLFGRPGVVDARTPHGVVALLVEDEGSA